MPWALAMVLFWLSVGLLTYTYALYPVALVILGMFRRRRDPVVPAVADAQSVSVILSVYNEAGIIGTRIRNLMTTRHPAGRMEILVGSDGSNDGTGEALGEFAGAGVRIFPYPARRGKAAVLNDLVREAAHPFLVFTDANTVYEPGTIPELLKPFADPAVGGVCGELNLDAGGDGPRPEGEASYWNYESRLKRLESGIGTILGATGAVYAIRKSLYTPLPTDRLVVDDFLVPLGILRQGYNVRYNPRARASEASAGSVAGEFRRKVRIGTANFFAIREFRDLLHPRWGFVAFALWSHKMIRWFAPVLLLTLAGVSLAGMGSSEFFRWCVILEACFAGLALLGAIGERLNIRVPLLILPYYFLAMNAALFVGMIKFLLDVRRPHWDVVR